MKHFKRAMSTGIYPLAVMRDRDEAQTVDPKSTFLTHANAMWIEKFTCLHVG